MARAKELLGDRVPCFFAPLDLIGPTQRSLNLIQPDALVLLETEIWPNLIVMARRLGVRVAIANGRISIRSIQKYRKIRSLMNYTLAHVDAFSMISANDALRIQSLGAALDRICVSGNAKFDLPDPVKDPHARQKASDLYCVADDRPVIVAGSTRNPEEPIVIDAFVQLRQKFPNALLIIAPRHIERAAQIYQWVTAQGMDCQLRTQINATEQPRQAPVVILDTIGELWAAYGIADMVFCGGSLAPKGGQNIMEPAMWAKPIIYGPSMEDFADAKAMIQANGGGVMIHDATEMASVAMDWLQSPEKAKAVGLAARQAILPHGGAAKRHAEVIGRLLG
jgi:3-deoxy-D-manno-octulosonic-acid transferase